MNSDRFLNEMKHANEIVKIKEKVYLYWQFFRLPCST